jgi:hypothetical protein
VAMGIGPTQREKEEGKEMRKRERDRPTCKIGLTPMLSAPSLTPRSTMPWSPPCQRHASARHRRGQGAWNQLASWRVTLAPMTTVPN